MTGGSAGGTLGRILAVNLLLGFSLVAASDLFRVGRFPLGYFAVLAHWTLFGLVTGSGSLAAATASAQPPSLVGLLTSRGCWETLAYTIVAAATTGLSLYRQLAWRTRKVRDVEQIGLTREDWLAVGAACLLLAAANATEALSLMTGS